MENKISILHGADYHVRNREKNLYNSYEKSLANIVQTIRTQQVEIYVCAGDLFDYADSNDSEKKLIYSHIAEILNIETLKEFVLMGGNHDFIFDKKQLESNRGNNSLDTLTQFIETLAPKLADKFTYLKLQKQYISKFDKRLGWIAYSLEDGMSNGNNINWDLVDTNLYNISVYHDIVVDFVTDTKLPVRKDKLEKLLSVKDFKTELVMAGDIHQKYTKSVDNGITELPSKFIYPGSATQVNFGEGTYIQIRKNSTIFKAATKSLQKYDIEFFEYPANTNKVKNVDYSDIELPTVISYITLDLNTNKVVPNFIDNIILLLDSDSAVYGENQTFIKLKLSSAYLEHELEIFKVVENISSTKNSVVEIHTVYDKFKMKSDVDNLITVEDEDSDNNIELTIDDLKLDTTKLNVLFNQVLDKHVFDLSKEIGEVSLVNDIVESIKTLFEEQIELSLSSIPNYSTKLNSVETNNFMNLGKNKILLSIPGLTRIKGTNGIGKTALLNLIRWIRDGVVFENLKANQKVKNSLLVFNDKLYNVDSVVGKLDFEVNDTNAVITRIATRKWKTNVTDEQKKSIEWRKYVTTVDTSIKLTVNTKSGVKEFTGDEAQSHLDSWFGNVTNNIMILNQHKILNMLNLPSDALQQLVLDYIGIDYLNTLKVNLPSIKNQYNLQKPKVSIADLKISMIEQNKIKDNGIENIEIYQKALLEVENDLKETKKLLSEHQSTLVNFGNVPDLIIETKQNIDIQQQIINNFVKQERLELPVFNVEKPIEPDNVDKATILNSYETKNIEQSDRINTVLKLDKNVVVAELVNELTLKINEAEGNIKNEYLKRYSDYQELINEKQTEFDNIFVSLNSKYDVTYKALQEKQTLQNNKINDLLNEIKTILIKNTEIEVEIESGVCDKCLKPISLTKEDFENHKIELLAEITRNNEKVEMLTTQKTEAINAKVNIDKFVNLYFDYVTNSASKNLQYFIGSEIVPGLVSEQDTYIKLTLLKTAIDTFKLYVNKLSFQDYSYFNELIENTGNENQDYTVFKLMLITIKNLTLDKKTNLECVEALRNENYEYFKVNNIFQNDLNFKMLIEINIEINNSLNIISENNIEIIKIKNEIDISRNDYIVQLQKYNTLFTEHNTNINNTISKNELIDRHNNSINEITSKLLQFQNNLFTLNLNLPLFEKLLVTIEETKKLENRQLNIRVSTYNLKLDLEKDLLLVDEKLKQIDVEYKNYLEYLKHTHIYKLYEKLINKDFPDIIFEYYRLFLNNTLNILLDGMPFKLFWDKTKELYMVEMMFGQQTYRPVQLVSGMQTCFLGLSLIYAIHKLNIKNSISHIFIDEIGGSLNSGKGLSQSVNIINYQEQLVKLLAKFDQKSVFIIDHVIDSMYESVTYNVELTDNGTAVYKMEV